MSIEIENFNYKGQAHGYQQWYWDENHNNIVLRGHYKNNHKIGYLEHHTAKTTTFYIR